VPPSPLEGVDGGTLAARGGALDPNPPLAGSDGEPAGEVGAADAPGGVSL